MSQIEACVEFGVYEKTKQNCSAYQVVNSEKSEKACCQQKQTRKQVVFCSRFVECDVKKLFSQQFVFGLLFVCLFVFILGAKNWIAGQPSNVAKTLSMYGVRV